MADAVANIRNADSFTSSSEVTAPTDAIIDADAKIFDAFICFCI
jgi:hypothetical protein